MEERLKSIEEKLDIIIAAMSVNPDFEKYVKEGLFNIKVEKLKVEIEGKNTKRNQDIKHFIIETIKTPGFIVSFDINSAMFSTRMKGYCSSEYAPKYAKEIIDSMAEIARGLNWDTRNFPFDEFVDDVKYKKDYCLEAKAEIVSRFGVELILEEEIKKLTK